MLYNKNVYKCIDIYSITIKYYIITFNHTSKWFKSLTIKTLFIHHNYYYKKKK